ncbi:MAG TPA: peptidoglycan-binding domain-containing protein [Alphaproteobacteria bacterium]|nr:peptidoglycan-binding domain-containing protein [Alphaproteobacteria bacterium]
MTRSMPIIAAALLVATSVGAFAATPATQPTATNTPKSQASLPSTDHHMSARRVEEIQAALQSKGEHVSTDGIWGRNTTAALRDFQKKNALKPTGRYDQATAQKLNIPHWS